MTQSEKISQLEKTVDFLRLYIEILSSKQSAINYSILDTLEKKYPEIYSEFYSKYVDALELSFNDKMDGIENQLFNMSNPLVSELQSKMTKELKGMKESNSYRQSEV